MGRPKQKNIEEIPIIMISPLLKVLMRGVFPEMMSFYLQGHYVKYLKLSDGRPKKLKVKKEKLKITF